MRLLVALDRWLDRFYLWCGYAAAALLVALALLIIASIVSRLLGAYVPGLTEYSGYAMAGASFLATPEATRDRLEAVGFEVVTTQNKREASLAYGARAREIVESGGKAPHRSVTLIHGEERAPVMAANVAQGTADEALIPIEVHCRRRG